MNNNYLYEEHYNRYLTNINQWLPDGLIEVDINTLQYLNLLHFKREESADPQFMHYFKASESNGKLTLSNQYFVIWITPDIQDDIPQTQVLIALNKESGIHLELGFVTNGIYNNSRIVLNILEKYLKDIQETEETIENIK